MIAAKERTKAAAGAADPMRPELYRVQRSRRESSDTFTLELTPPRGYKPTPFQPGQFNMLYMPGVGECAISISGDPADDGVLLHTTRVVGTVTRALNGCKAGSRVGIRGPYGAPWPVAEAEGNDVVFVAGGIGLAPLRPAIFHVLAHRRQYGRIVLLYGARTPEDILFKPMLRKWSSRLDMDVYVTVDRAEAGWRGNVGVVTNLIKRAPFDRLNTTAFICGPEIMMHYTVLEILGRGVNEKGIYVSLERNMKCATGFCGHCQMGPFFVCKDGPVFRYDKVKRWMEIREL